MRRQRSWLKTRHVSKLTPVVATLLGTLMIAFTRVVNFSISTDWAFAAKIMSYLLGIVETVNGATAR
jgi:hypothetical protein